MSNAGDPSLIPGSGRSPGEGIGYPLQYSGLENSMDCIVFEVAKSQIQLTFTVTYPVDQMQYTTAHLVILCSPPPSLFLSLSHSISFHHMEYLYCICNTLSPDRHFNRLDFIFHLFGCELFYQFTLYFSHLLVT